MNCFQTFHFNQLALVFEMPDNYPMDKSPSNV